MARYGIINSIKEDKKEIEERMSKLSNIKTTSMVTINIMTETWLIKSSFDWLRKWLEDDYYNNNNLTRNQYKLVRRYLEIYENQVWSRLYDIAQKHDFDTIVK